MPKNTLPKDKLHTLRLRKVDRVMVNASLCFKAAGKDQYLEYLGDCKYGNIALVIADGSRIWGGKHSKGHLKGSEALQGGFQNLAFPSSWKSQWEWHALSNSLDCNVKNNLWVFSKYSPSQNSRPLYDVY